MAKNTTFRPSLEACEPRVALSGGLSARALAAATGNVAVPHATAGVPVPISPRNLGRRHSIVVGASASPAPGSNLIPSITRATGPTGKPLRLRQGIPSLPGKHPATQAYIRTGQPGTLQAGVTGRKGTTGAFQLEASLPGDINGDGQVTLDDLSAFVTHYGTTPRDPAYDPVADANHNGFIGQGDARFLLRNLQPITPKIPLSVHLTLGPQDQARGRTSPNSGGVTRNETVTILGRTTPGAIVFADSGLGDYSFSGPALATDAQGNFAIQVKNTDGVNTFNFLTIDPYGQQVIRSFPIFYIPVAAGG